MNTKQSIGAAVVIGSLLVATTASAQQKDTSVEANASPAAPKAPERAVELKIDTGYSQGFGNVGAGRPSLTDVGNAGGVVGLGLGYRFTRNLMVGIYGTGAEFARGDQVDSSTNLFSATAGAEANWHFLPDREIDPWVGVGSGWRGYWAHNDQGTLSQHGWEIARVQVGVDYRVSEAVAISPVIGADLSMFFTEQKAGESGWNNIASPNANTFVFGGVAGRFDIATESSDRTTAKR